MNIKLSNKMYDFLKWVAQYLLPALGTLYFALSRIWGFPCGEEVVGTVTALDTFLAVILGLSNSSYEGEGVVEVNTHDPEKDKIVLNFTDDDPVEVIKNRKYVTFKVNHTDDP